MELYLKSDNDKKSTSNPLEINLRRFFGKTIINKYYYR